MLCCTDGNPQRATRIEKYLIIKKVKKYYPVSRICKVLDINRGSYYKWLSKGSPIMNNFSSSVARIIIKEHTNLNATYGTIRLKEHIKRKYNLTLNHKRIRRYKNALKLKCCVRKKKSLPTRLNAKEKVNKNKAEYILLCDFRAKKPRTKLTTDVSYIKCSDGRLYLSALKDLYNKEIVSFYCSERNDINLVKKTFENVKLEEEAIINTDQGSLYYSYEYVKISQELKFIRSMSHKGHCWENSPIENWFSQLKSERLRLIGIKSKKETKEEIKKYVQWYNTERIQKSLGYLSPIEYRLKYS